MKSLRILTLMLVLHAPITQTVTNISSSPLIVQLLLNDDVMDKLITKGVFVTVGTTTALCGCVLATLGVKRTLTEDNKAKSGLLLTASGIAATLLGLHIALNK